MNSNNLSDVALEFFIAASTINVIGLLVDYGIIKLGYTSITDYCREHPALGITFILFESILPLVLSYHLFGNTAG